MMIRTYLLSLIATLTLMMVTAVEADAFPERERGWIPGFIGGVNYSTVNHVPNGLSADPLIGFSAGMTLERHLAPEFVFRPQVTYNQKGFVVDDEIVDENNGETEVYDFSYRSEYIETFYPIIYSFELHSEFVPQVFLGPTLSFGIDGELDIDEMPEEMEEMFEEEPGLFDFGATVGIGGIQHFRNFALTIDLRYNWGFLDTGIHDEDSIRNQGASLNLGFRF